jgi:hypothetical protein
LPGPAEERRISQPDLHVNKLAPPRLTDDFRRAAKSVFLRPIR